MAIAGVFKAVAPRAMGTLKGTLKASLVGNHVRQLRTDASLGSFTTGAQPAAGKHQGSLLVLSGMSHV